MEQIRKGEREGEELGTVRAGLVRAGPVKLEFRNCMSRVWSRSPLTDILVGYRYKVSKCVP